MKHLFKKGLFKKQAARITGDFVINILASVIYTFARQIVVFPLLAARLTDGDYGTLLTVTGLANVCTSLVGTSLNNIRLVQNSRYEEAGENGDFNLLCLAGSALSVVFSLVLWAVFRYSWLTALLLTGHILVANLYQYASAFFRLELNFRRILRANILVSGSLYSYSVFFQYGFCILIVFLFRNPRKKGVQADASQEAVPDHAVV